MSEAVGSLRFCDQGFGICLGERERERERQSERERERERASSLPIKGFQNFRASGYFSNFWVPLGVLF